MPKINCTVDTCSYNKSNVCRASIINVGGKGATSDCSTCCGTFLNRLGYSNLAQFTDNRGDTDAILCQVDTCVYNKAQHCGLQEINVGSQSEAEVYTQTDCNSFKAQ